MKEERCIIVDGEELIIKYFTPEEEEIFASISEEMWESDRASELNYAKEEGRRKNKIEIARKLLELKMSIEEISKITELSEEEIEKLK